MQIKKVVEELKLDEGFRSKTYRCPAGQLTIGYGTNIEAGIDRAEAEMLLRYRVERAYSLLVKTYPWFTSLTENRQDVFVNMLYNMGAVRFAGFKKMLAAAEAGDHENVVKEMLDSKWATQVGGRATALAGQWRNG